MLDRTGFVKWAIDAQVLVLQCVGLLGGVTMTGNLQQEYDYYLEHRTELLEKYSGKVLVIMGQALIGVFDSEVEALRKMSKSHEVGTFLIQVCDPSEQSYTQTYHSRVIFI